MSLLPRICSGCLGVTIYFKLKTAVEVPKGIGKSVTDVFDNGQSGEREGALLFPLQLPVLVTMTSNKPSWRREMFSMEILSISTVRFTTFVNTARQEHEFCRLEVGFVCSSCVWMGFFDSSGFHLECKYWAMFDFRRNVCFSVQWGGKSRQGWAWPLRPWLSETRAEHLTDTWGF